MFFWGGDDGISHGMPFLMILAIYFEFSVQKGKLGIYMGPYMVHIPGSSEGTVTGA